MSIQLKTKPEIFHGKVTDWNWTRDYGIVRMENGKELFLHYSNVKIKARDLSGNLIKLKLNDKGFPALNAEGDSFVRADKNDPPNRTQQIYGRPAARGFMDERGNEIEMKKHQIWFDISEIVYFTTSKDYPNVCFNVTLNEQDTLLAIVEEENKKTKVIDIDEENDKYADRKISYTSNTDEEGNNLNATKVKEVKTPARKNDYTFSKNKTCVKRKYTIKRKKMEVTEIPPTPPKN